MKSYCKNINIPLVFFIIYFILQIVLHYSGIFSYDSNASWSQFNLKEYNDWHPPILTIWWQIFHVKSAFYIIHYLILCICLCVLSILLYKSDYVFHAWILMIYFSQPLIFGLKSTVWKDIAMIDGLLVIIALSVLMNRNKLVGSIKILYLILLLLMIYYCLTVRANGVFAVIPILFYIVLKNLNIKNLIIRCSVVVLIVVITYLINVFITYRVFDAQHLYPQSNIILNDLAHIECATDHRYKIPDMFFLSKNIDRQNLCQIISNGPASGDILVQKNGPLILNLSVFGHDNNPQIDNSKYQI